MKNDNHFFSKVQKGFIKLYSFLPIYGFLGTIKLLSKNFFQIEQVYRLERDLYKEEEVDDSAFPLNFKIIDKNFQIDNWVGKEKILKIRGIYGLSQFKERIARGDLCFTAYHKGEFVGFNWLQFPPSLEAGYKLDSNEGYTFDGWVFEEFRGNRTHTYIKKEIINYLFENRKDIKKLVTHIAIKNKASIKGNQRVGYKIIRRELTFVFMGFHRRFFLNDKRFLSKLFTIFFKNA